MCHQSDCLPWFLIVSTCSPFPSMCTYSRCLSLSCASVLEVFLLVMCRSWTSRFKDDGSRLTYVRKPFYFILFFLTFRFRYVVPVGAAGVGYGCHVHAVQPIMWGLTRIIPPNREGRGEQRWDGDRRRGRERRAEGERVKTREECGLQRWVITGKEVAFGCILTAVTTWKHSVGSAKWSLYCLFIITIPKTFWFYFNKAHLLDCCI